MRTLLLLIALGCPAVHADHLLITAFRYAYQQPGYDPADPPIETKSSDDKQTFALELTDDLRDQIIPHGEDHPGGIKLGIRAGYRSDATSRASTTQYTWWIARDDAGRVHVHGWPNGNEVVLARTIRAGHPGMTTQMRFDRLEAINFGAYVSYVEDLSGANIGVNLRVVPNSDPDLATAHVITATKPGATTTNCEAKLTPFFAEAFLQ